MKKSTVVVSSKLLWSISQRISYLRIWEDHPGDTSKSSIGKRDAGDDDAADSSSGDGNFTELLFHKVEYTVK